MEKAKDGKWEKYKIQDEISSLQKEWRANLKIGVVN